MPRQQNLRQGMDLVAPGGKKWGPGLPNATAPGSSSMDTSTTWAPRTRSPMPASPWGRRRPGFRFHDLRHTFATTALQNGVDVKTVSSMLGHFDAGFTLRTYTHATRQKQDEAAQTMGSFMAQVM